MNCRIHILLGILVTIGLSALLITSCNSDSLTGMIIMTQYDSEGKTADFVSGQSWRYLEQSRLVAFDPTAPEKSMKVISQGFHSACSPQISCDGKSMLFAGQRNEGDFWQIWEMNLKNKKIRQVSSSMENCIDPVYIPGNRLIFSGISTSDTLKAGHSLYSCNLDGSNIQRITFSPHSYFATGVLQDGRIVTINRQLYPDQSGPSYFVMRPDGAKADLFYQNGNTAEILGRPWQTTGGTIVFIESDSVNHRKGNLISIRYNRPLHSRVNLTEGIDGDFHSVFPENQGKYLVSYRKSDADRFALYEFDAENKALGKPVLASADYDILEAVVVRESNVPKKLPSEVDKGVKTGLLLCQDINMLDPECMLNASSNKKATRIEVLGINASLGIVPVEADGSFYLKAMADTPFRIQTLDESGKVVHGPGAWIWLRPNERRGCVGCHEDREMAPENNAPLSVRKDPVIIPVHVTEVTEKEVELE